jgi:peroxiredoxin
MKLNSQTGLQSRREQIAAQQRRARIRNLLMAFGGILILLAIFLLIFRSSPVQSVRPPQVGSKLGDFSLQSITGETVRLSDYEGRPVLINTWAIWCPPCKAEMPLLNEYYQAHAAEGFVILAINAGDTQAEAAAFASQNSLQFPILLDPGTQLLDQMAIHSFPTSILIGRDGLVKAIHIGLLTQESIEVEISPHLK